MHQLRAFVFAGLLPLIERQEQSPGSD